MAVTSTIVAVVSAVVDVGERGIGGGGGGGDRSRCRCHRRFSDGGKICMRGDEVFTPIEPNCLLILCDLQFLLPGSYHSKGPSCP